MILLFQFYTISRYSSQSITPFKVRKDNNTFVFFQKGISTDTVTKISGNHFYLMVNDSLKKYFLIQIENAQFTSTTNDSVVKLKYMKKLKYECIYTEIIKKTPLKPNKNQSWKFETLINGVSVVDENKILIKIIDKRNENILIENTFFYRE